MLKPAQHSPHISWYSSVPHQYIPNYIEYVSQTSRTPTKVENVYIMSRGTAIRCLPLSETTPAVRPAASSGFHGNMRLLSAAEGFAIPCCSAVDRAALFTGSLRERADTHVRWATMYHHISTLSGAQYTG